LKNFFPSISNIEPILPGEGPSMNKSALIFLPVLALFSAGCPYKRYEITMTPRGDAVEREFVLSRQDTESSSKARPNKEALDADELAAIAAFYPANGVMKDGERYTARGEFAGDLPGDVGGSGRDSRLATSMGSAGIYFERFRGSDDPAQVLEKRYQALDQFADLIIGWSYVNFGREPNYQNLRQFLDGDFRHDLKNLSFYFLKGNDGLLNIEGSEARIAQYMIERHYMNIEDAAELLWGKDEIDDRAFCRVLQRVIAGKLDAAEGRPVPQALAFLANQDRLQDSWKDYLAGTEAYRAKLRIWENEKFTNPDAPKPEPDSVAEDLMAASLLSASDSGQDQVIVRLSLPSEPLDTNGKWDGEHKQVVWDSRLPVGDRLPVFCYADWVEPQDGFQNEHLGGVRLTGRNLQNYCFWRTNLDEGKAGEWERFLAGLHPGSDPDEQLKNFRFAGEPVQLEPNAPKRLSDIGRELIQSAFKEKQ
jgi:hypothetical protein